MTEVKQEDSSLTIETQKIDTNTLSKKEKRSYAQKILQSLFTRKSIFHRKESTSAFTDSVSMQNIYLQTQNNRIIQATLVKPKNTNEYTKHVIMAHGRGTNRHEFAHAFPVQELVETNCVVLIPDFNVIEDTNADVQRCVDYMRHVFEADTVSFVSHCVGAGIVLNYCRYIGNRPVLNQVGRVVLISPITSEVDLIRESRSYRLLSRFKNINLDKICAGFNHNNLENIMHVKKENVIIFHGTKDAFSPFQHGLRLANERGCKIYRSEVDNYYSILKNEEVLKKIDDFFSENGN